MDLQGGDNSNRPSNGHHRDPFSRRRNLQELLHLNDDDSGYIEGKVFMIWPPRNKLHRINLEVAEDSALYRFELEAPHKDGIAFRPHERICFALEGAKVDPRGESSAPHYFPIVLRYPKGVVLKYLTGVNAGKVVDTWAENTDEWYNPGMVSDAITTGASETRHGPVSTANNLVPPQGDVHRLEGMKTPQSITTTDDTDAAQPIQSVQQPSTERSGRSSKTRARRKRRSMKKPQESVFSNRPADDTGTPRHDVTILSHEKGSLASVSDSHPKCSRYAEGEVSVLKDNDISRENACSNIPEQVLVPTHPLKAGFRTERGDIFTPLSDLQKDFTINVIGVVTSVNMEKKTRTNEWCRTFTLTDPSTFDSLQQNIKVNCFQKKYVEWLPQVQKEDVVILRRLKVVEFIGALSTTGHNDKLRWAVYDPSKHSIRPPNRGNAPGKELLDDGLGYEFSPFWEPFQDSTELEYCRQIGEWWQAMHKFKGEKVSTVVCSPPARRQHLLISEASPNRPPRGFFNCTVEVLHKFNNQGSAMTTIYVTDYTTSSLVYAEQGAWCSPELFGRVLQCNMWDDARETAKMMNSGEYWYLNNIRARQNPNGYMEGTMQLAEKVVRLDEAYLEAQPQLHALLERKKEFERNKSACPTSGLASPHVFPHMLIQDVEMSTSFLTCVIELLHVDFDSPDGHFIFVTDYTFNPDLPTAVSSAEWADKLEHRVVKIKLDDTQAKIASNLKPGCRCTIRNLRIKHSSVFGGVHGYLGGEEKLIVYLDDSSSHGAQMLQRNKEKWNRELMLNIPTTSHRESDEPFSQSLTTLSTLREVLSGPAPNVYKVLARTVDFFPFSLEDACVLQCTKCESSPSRILKGCPRCDDMMETHCRWFYRVYILLQDEKDTELVVSLSEKECTLLQDIEPTDFGCDRVAFGKFQEKLDPIFGNLKEVHAAWSKNEDKIIESPLMTFAIESCNVGDEKVYGLLYCTPT